uniref:Uncharacterized protein n=1 Tax=Oryza glumipatula TaxID=40148 RepID=A0A0E0ADT7_9ORYZ
MDEDGRRHHRQTTFLHVAAALLDAAAMDEVAAAVHWAALKWAQVQQERRWREDSLPLILGSDVGAWI